MRTTIMVGREQKNDRDRRAQSQEEKAAADAGMIWPSMIFDVASNLYVLPRSG